MDIRNTPKTDNALLDAMDIRSWLALEPHLQNVELARGCEIAGPNRPVEYCYFLTEGIGSIIAEAGHRMSAEVGLVGREGVLPITPLLDVDTSPFRIVMQVEGRALRIKADVLKNVMDSYPDLRRLLNRFIHALIVQGGGTAFANANHTVEQRSARWILMYLDRSSGDRIALTHEFLSTMMAVRRASVTTALHVLEGNHLIRSERNLVVVRDRAGLEAFACLSYGQPENEYRRLIGTS